MSDFGKDVEAAEQEFLDIFETEDKKINGKLAKIFLKAFLPGYRDSIFYAKHQFSNPDTVNIYAVRCLSAGAQKINRLGVNVVNNEGINKEGEARVLGELLGLVLAGLEIIADARFKVSPSTVSDVMASVKLISNKLKSLGKNVKHEFILRRVNSIAKRNAGKLSEDKKKLYASIAAAFSE